MKKLVMLSLAGALAVIFSATEGLAGRGGFGGGGMHMGGGGFGGGGAHFGGMGGGFGGAHFGGMGGGFNGPHFGGMGGMGGPHFEGMGGFGQPHIGGVGGVGGIGRSAFGPGGRPGGIDGGLGRPIGGFGTIGRPIGGAVRPGMEARPAAGFGAIGRPAEAFRPGVGYRPGFDNHYGYGYGGRPALANPYYRPNYYGGWYHGSWHNNWNEGWYGRPVGWGWGWGGGFVAGAMLTSPWSWGYMPYYNPYYVAGAGPTYINYSQPIVSTADASTATAPIQSVVAGQTEIPGVAVQSATPTDDAKDEAMTLFDTARIAFRKGDYAAAQTQIEQAISKAPTDSVLHEFRALVLFATNDYKGAAAALYAVLSAGPGWDWTTMIALYANADVYTDQVRQLEEYRKANPDVPEARFVLAYHYLTQGHTAAAATELKKAVELNPKDTLSAEILRSITPAAAGTPPAPTPDSESPTPAAAAKALDPARLVGQWSASRSDGSTFSLTLTRDKKFTWQFTQGKQTQKYSGPYTIADNILILKQNDDPAMVFEVTATGDNSYHFKLAGSEAHDPGLDFSR